MLLKKVLFPCILLTTILNLLAHVDNYTLKLVTGSEQKQLISFIAQQRISSYREYPYLYEGNIEEETVYLSWLVALPHSAIAVAYLGSEPVGFVSGASCVDFDEHFKGSIDIFKKAGLLPEAYYYFTDVIVAPEHRGHALGARLFGLIEQHAQSLGYSAGCCVTESHETHPLKPAHYKSIDSLLSNLAYKRSSMAIHFNWLTRQVHGDSIAQEHILTYWLKSFTSAHTNNDSW